MRESAEWRRDRRFRANLLRFRERGGRMRGREGPATSIRVPRLDACASRLGTSTRSAPASPGSRTGSSARTSTCWPCRKPSARPRSSRTSRSSGRLRARAARPQPVERRRVRQPPADEESRPASPACPASEVPGRHRLPLEARALGGDVQRRAGVEPVRAQRPRTRGSPLRLQAGLARQTRDATPGWLTEDRPRRSPSWATGTSPRSTRTSGTSRISPDSTTLSPPERAAFAAIEEAGFSDACSRSSPTGLHLLGLPAAAVPANEGMRIDLTSGEAVRRPVTG